MKNREKYKEEIATVIENNKWIKRQMTAKELYEWAKNNGVESYNLITSHETGEGAYNIDEAEVFHKTKEIQLY